MVLVFCDKPTPRSDTVGQNTWLLPELVDKSPRSAGSSHVEEVSQERVVTVPVASVVQVADAAVVRPQNEEETSTGSEVVAVVVVA